MDRRQWLRNAALIASGAVAADQIDLLEQLGGWARRFFPSAAVTPAPLAESLIVTNAELNALLKKVYTDWRHSRMPVITPLYDVMRKPKSLYDVPTQWGGTNGYFDLVTRT